MPGVHYSSPVYVVRNIDERDQSIIEISLCHFSTNPIQYHYASKKSCYKCKLANLTKFFSLSCMEQSNNTSRNLSSAG